MASGEVLFALDNSPPVVRLEGPRHDVASGDDFEVHFHWSEPLAPPGFLPSHVAVGISEHGAWWRAPCVRSASSNL